MDVVAVDFVPEQRNLPIAEGATKFIVAKPHMKSKKKPKYTG